ncbi:hypothetical protein LXL04_030900 [Taraxacum kok-saghyz]
MVTGGVISQIQRTVVTRCRASLIFHVAHDNRKLIPVIRNSFHSLHCAENKGVTVETKPHNPVFTSYLIQKFGISSSASLHSKQNGTSQNEGESETANTPNDAKESEEAENSSKLDASDQKEEESSSEEEDLSVEDLVKLVTEKETLLKKKQKEIEEMKDKVLRTYAEMENVMERTKREAENSKKFAIQNFAKGLLDVADNLGRASSVVKESFVKIDTSQDSSGAVPLLKTLLEGVEMTEKQLSEVFKKFGVEKYDPTDEQFDPNRHNAVFQVPDPTKPPDQVAVVLKAGYMLHDRIIRPAEVEDNHPQKYEFDLFSSILKGFSIFTRFLILSSIKKTMVSIDNLPDQLLWDIFSRIKNTIDRNSLSLTSKRFHNLDNEQRNQIRIGCGLNPANNALTSLCHRFPNLNKIEITYSGWMSNLGKQLEDEGLSTLSKFCPLLTDLTLSYCTFITDTGLTFISSCTKLSSLKLNFTPRITGCGIFSIVVTSKNLKTLHLTRCLNITNLEWLECLGHLQTLEDLSVKNCRGIGEGALFKLGPTWRTLKRLRFEVDSNYRYMKLYDRLSVDKWHTQWVPCENMTEVNLVNCIVTPGRGLACILNKCKNLEMINLDMCVGTRDSDITALAKNSKNLREISIRVPSDFSLLENPLLRLTDESLNSIAGYCTQLESLTLSFSDGDFPSLSSFSQTGILNLIKTCPLKKLVLDRVYSFNNVGMKGLCLCENLEVLELVRCQEVSDEGVECLGGCGNLRVLRLVKCLGVTDDGFKGFKGLRKLEVVVVNDCPQVSLRGVEGVAKYVSFKQDLSWMY